MLNALLALLLLALPLLADGPPPLVIPTPTPASTPKPLPGPVLVKVHRLFMPVALSDGAVIVIEIGG